MKNRTIKALLKEERKALQFLHAGYGFDFESPFFIKKIKGKFTFNMVKKAIEEKLSGDYTAAALIKPAQRWNHPERLHIINIGSCRFERPERQQLKPYNYNIDDFYSVGDFEETRKNQTESVYIIAQNNDFLKHPRPQKIDYTARYKINNGGIRTCGDQHGHTWIDKIGLIPPHGERYVICYEPFNCFYHSERIAAGTDINNFIDKSGYLIRQKRHDLLTRAKQLKAERDKAALLKADFTAREKELKEKLNRAKAFLSDLVLKTNSSDGAELIAKASNYMRQVFWKWERIAGKDDYFSSIAQKEKYLDDIEILTNSIFLIEEA